MHSTWELPHFYSMEMLRDPVIRVFSLSLSSLSMIFGIFFFIFFRQFRRGILTNFPYIPKLLLSSYEDENEKIIDQLESSFSTSHSTGGAEIERKSIPFETIAIFRDRRGSELFFFPFLFVSLLFPYIPVSKLHRHVAEPRMTAYFALLFARLVCL